MKPVHKTTPAHKWERTYQRRLVLSDAAAIFIAVFGSQLIRFGTAPNDLIFATPRGFINLTLSYTLISFVITVLWMFAISYVGSRDPVVFSLGSLEYKRIIDATLQLFGLLAIVAYLAKAELGRGYFLLALPIGLGLLLFTRWAWRWRLGRRRIEGHNSYRTLIIGARHKVDHVAADILRERTSGIVPVGALTSCEQNSDSLSCGLPVWGHFSNILEVIDKNKIDTVVYTGSDEMGADKLRELGWGLQKLGVNLIVAPSLTDIAGPRIHARPVSGLPLIHVDYPEFEGSKYSSKRAMDILGSALGLILLSPVFLVLSIMVKRDSPGNIFFHQDRVGLNGHPFKMIKFRSMVANAEDQLPSLLDRSEGNDILFKIKNDPRVTALGQMLRRFSLDELPQLVNVLRGEMSLVGPRPPLKREVDLYDDAALRRLLVKPGMTGLWQVSGRSDLSWEDSVRLDLYYVENWSMTGDFMIIWRTFKAVKESGGAY